MMMTGLRAAMAAAVIVGASAAGAIVAHAHSGHPLFAAPMVLSTQTVAENGPRVDVIVGFQLANPTEVPVIVTGVTALAGAQASLVENPAGGGRPVSRFTVAPGETVTFTPPRGGLLVRNAPKAAVDGPGIRVTLLLDGGDRMSVLVRR